LTSISPQRVGPRAALDLDHDYIGRPDALEAGLPQFCAELRTDHEPEPGDETRARRVGVYERPIPLDPEDWIRVLVRELRWAGPIARLRSALPRPQAVSLASIA
jgi:hypothetical protein